MGYWKFSGRSIIRIVKYWDDNIRPMISNILFTVFYAHVLCDLINHRTQLTVSMKTLFFSLVQLFLYTWPIHSYNCKKGKNHGKNLVLCFLTVLLRLEAVEVCLFEETIASLEIYFDFCFYNFHQYLSTK